MRIVGCEGGRRMARTAIELVTGIADRRGARKEEALFMVV